MHKNVRKKYYTDYHIDMTFILTWLQKKKTSKEVYGVKPWLLFVRIAIFFLSTHHHHIVIFTVSLCTPLPFHFGISKDFPPLKLFTKISNNIVEVFFLFGNALWCFAGQN